MADTILIIDDEEPVRRLLREIFEGRGFHVQEASGGQEALLLCQTNQPKLVIVDILVPQMDGLEIIRQLVKEFHGTKILAISGGGMHSPL